MKRPKLTPEQREMAVKGVIAYFEGVSKVWVKCTEEEIRKFNEGE